mmetsp:Transcript_25167/g.79298  ORF Transcript_25167/g.79298 Transcript_25167/m.79298 type:complete len:277 (+) Transcript_25167:780-1610(+)
MQSPPPVFSVAAVKVADGGDDRDQATSETCDGSAEPHHRDVPQAHEHRHRHHGGGIDVEALRRAHQARQRVPRPHSGEEVAIEVRVANAARKACERHGEHGDECRPTPDALLPDLRQRVAAGDGEGHGVVVRAEEAQPPEEGEGEQRGQDAPGRPAHDEAAGRGDVREGGDDHDPPLGGVPAAELRRPRLDPPAAVGLKVRGGPLPAPDEGLALPGLVLLVALPGAVVAGAAAAVPLARGDHAEGHGAPAPGRLSRTASSSLDLPSKAVSTVAMVQ